MRQAYEEFAKLVNQFAELVSSMHNELYCIGLKCLKDDGKNLETVEVIIGSLEEKINHIKEANGLI